jgi:hypothetical protein
MRETNNPKRKRGFWDNATLYLLIGVPAYIGGKYIYQQVEQVKQKNNTYWSASTKASIKSEFMKRADLQVMTVKARNYFCDCYINQLEKSYPKGIAAAVPQDSTTKFGSHCVEQMTKHQKELQ